MRIDWTTIPGEVILPGEPGYDAARTPAITRFADAPVAVVRCATPAGVAETIALARQHGLVVAPRSGGHCFAGRSSTRGIVIDTSPMRSVSVSDGVATVGAGTKLGDLYDALGERTIPAGCGPTVGIAGLTLGGGFGILGRRHGLTCDHLLGAQVVLADGRVVECDDHRDPDLFWALRGAGGGQFGVVTSLWFRTVPAPAATAFHLVWTPDNATRAIEAWLSFAPDAPDELAASLLVVAGADIRVNVFGAMLGTESDTAELLRVLVDRVGADPVSVHTGHRSFRDTKRYLAELGETMTGSPQGDQLSKSEYFVRPLPAEVVAALVAGLEDRAPGEVRELDFSPWGGAYNRVSADATAFAHRGPRYLLKQAVTAPQVTRDWLDRSWSLTRPHGTGGVYPNFPDPSLPDSTRAYHGDNLSRLRRIKAQYDPDAFFCFPQSIEGYV